MSDKLHWRVLDLVEAAEELAWEKIHEQQCESGVLSMEVIRSIYHVDEVGIQFTFDPHRNVWISFQAAQKRLDEEDD